MRQPLSRALGAGRLPLGALLVFGCGGSADTQPAPLSAVAPSGRIEGCEVMPSGPAAPVSDPNGPYYHQAVVARTTDGTTLTGARQVLDHASVPDGVRLLDGSVAIYYVNGAEGGVWVARLEGDTAVPLGPIAIDGVTAPAGVVDPDATALPDGGVRLVYLNGFGSPTSPRPRAMCIADSRDGVRFEVAARAIRFPETEMTTDPSVVQLRDGSWLMAVSRGQQTIMARAQDGLAFEAYDTLRVGGVPELASLGDGRVRLYVCAPPGIESYLSPDAGRSWQREALVVPTGTGGRRIVCDPSFVAGAGLFIYKTAN